MNEAKKTKSEGIVKMDVEGASAKPRMDRPGRKIGGRVCKADGGDVDEDTKPVSNYLKNEASTKRFVAGAKMIPSAAGTALMLDVPHPLAKVVGGGLALAGAPLVKSAYKDALESGQMDDAARRFDKSGLPGRPAPGPDRKNGGRAVKKKG